MTGTKKNVQISEENGLLPPCYYGMTVNNVIGFQIELVAA